MDKENNGKNRSKLTLKLPTSSDSKTLALKSKAKALKNAESKRISNSLVQVTIKGRKKENNTTQANSGKLSNSEFEARQRAVEKNLNKEDTTQNFQDENQELLSKIKKEPLSESPKITQEPKARDDDANTNKEKTIESTSKEKTEAQKETAPDQQTLYKVDNFDVRDKIKQSIETDNRQKYEKEKIAKEKIKKSSKSKKVDKVENFDNEEKKTSKKSKIAFKEKRSNRRLLQTFIVNDDDGDYRQQHGRRKTRTTKSKVQKDYVKITKEIILPELISVSDLADRMSEKCGDVVKKLFTMGSVATSNQIIDADTAELIISEFGHTVKRVLESDVENILDIDNDLLEKPPIVTIMGHVDHGKTSLLDAMRSTNIVANESGGITQHIGASRIKTNSGKYITFLDTPGHEAFTEMRLRGANVTDIVILVVAADDGVKEQTIEAINHAKAADVPIIVAVNKIDKPGADPLKIKNELLNYEIVAEDLSGDTMFVEVSAKNKTNLDKLEEAILLQAEILELKAPYNTKAQGVVIETRVDSAKGITTSLIVQKGTLNISDIVVAGTAYGRVKKMNGDKGKDIKSATPSVPVEMLGLNSSPNAGDQFFIVSEEKQARDIIAYRSLSISKIFSTSDSKTLLTVCPNSLIINSAVSASII